MKIAYFSKANRLATSLGILVIVALATIAMIIGKQEVTKHLGISPLIAGILIGMLVGNTFRSKLSSDWGIGYVFCSKIILRAAIILYGFKITFQELSSVGLQGFLVSLSMVITTMLLGWWMGERLFGLDRETAILTASGSAVCGAAAVMATEGVLKAPSHKSSMAVATVVLFGTISMFLFPLFYKFQLLGFSPKQYGLYIGGSVHEVAQVVAAGNAIGVPEAEQYGVIVKMTRVLLLAPLLIGISWFVRRQQKEEVAEKPPLYIPWFVLGFVVVIGINSVGIFSKSMVDWFKEVDTWLLTIAMTALGMETNFQKIKNLGMRPLYLALAMFGWLVFGGYVITKLISSF